MSINIMNASEHTRTNVFLGNLERLAGLQGLLCYSGPTADLRHTWVIRKASRRAASKSQRLSTFKGFSGSPGSVVVCNRGWTKGAAAFGASSRTVLSSAHCGQCRACNWHFNEDHVIPQPQLLECLYPLMVTTIAEAMDGESCLTGGSSVSDGPGGLAT
jgi:hypothetical protein